MNRRARPVVFKRSADLEPSFTVNAPVSNSSCFVRLSVTSVFSGPPKTERVVTERIHHPNACCGANPYDRDTKGCCKVVSRDQPVVFTKLYQGCCGGHIIEKSGQGCCKNKPYHLEDQDCCDGDIEDASTFPGTFRISHKDHNNLGRKLFLVVFI